MGRYSADVENEDQCLEACAADPQCMAYSYGFPLCSIYGTVRTNAPIGSRPWFFEEGSTQPVAVAVERASLTALGQRATVCRRKGSEEDTEEDFGKLADITVADVFGAYQVALFFCVLVCVFFSCCICRTCYTCQRAGRGTVGADSSTELQHGIVSEVTTDANKPDDLRALANDSAGKAALAPGPPDDAIQPVQNPENLPGHCQE